MPIEPLLPRPGTFEAIVRRARRRRLNRAMTAAGATAVVIAAAVFVPQLTSLLTARGVSTALPDTRPRTPAATQAQPARGTSAPPQTTGTAGPLVSRGFTPASVSFIGLNTGWALGRYPAPCPGGGCTALARTDDTGQHWYRVPAPDAGPPDGGNGVSQVRFLNTSDGWVFGPQLWATHDGGQTWTQVSTGGQRVISLETAGDRVFAVFAQCAGTGSTGSTDCSSHQLYSVAASGGAWSAVPGGSGPGTASLALTRRTGYLLGRDGQSLTLWRGPVSGGPWSAVSRPECGQQPAQPTPQPGAPTSTPTAAATAGGTGSTPTALLAAGSPDTLFLLCGPGAGGQPSTVYVSTDGGRDWGQRGPAPGGSATSVAAVCATAGTLSAAPSGCPTLLIATTSGVYVSRDGGKTWQMPLQVAGGGIVYVGMTGTLQGFAVPAGQGAVWFTADGGQSWHQSAI